VIVSTVDRQGQCREHRAGWRLLNNTPGWTYLWADEDTPAAQGLDCGGAAVAEAR
jgi:hypothetical protein